MGFELRHKGKREKKGQKRSQDFHKALNKLCASQILGGGKLPVPSYLLLKWIKKLRNAGNKDLALELDGKNQWV